LRDLRFQRAVLALTVIAFAFTSIYYPPPAAAQLREVILAPGFQFNLFADPANVPEFAVDSFTGPGAMAFDPRGRLFVTTLSGKILILLDNDEDGRSDEVKTFATGVPLPLGIAIRGNGDVFISSNIFGGKGRIMRLRDLDGDDRADEITTVIDDLPSQGKHQTGRLKFGPDGTLYFGQGSATDKGQPDPGRTGESNLNATILRINVNTVVTPIVQVIATGLRNPFGLAFHPENRALFATDAGSGDLCIQADCSEDTSPPEEVNWIVQGGNYGFPQCEGTPTAANPSCAGVRPPAIQYLRHLTPTALAFYTGPQAGEFRNHLLLTIYNNLPNLENHGGDLRRIIVEGDTQTGFRLRDDGFIAQFDPIDPGDGPTDVVIDPINGDIYVIRFDPVNHRDPDEHHHFIYRIHRQGSDALPFIGPVSPSSVKAGSGAVTINLIGRRLKPGAVVLADGVPVTTRQGATRFDLIADLPAALTATQGNIAIEVRNGDGTRSNSQSFAVTQGDPDPDPDPDPEKTPQITSLFVYKKKRSKVVDQVTVGSKAKKLRLVVTGTDFEAGAQLLINGESVQLDSSGTTELVGRFTNAMLAAPGELMIQVRNATGKTSNTIRLAVVSRQ
jgi:glucose/arabinose dehydrogenase